MANDVYLSLWLQNFDTGSMLLHWRRALEGFPASPDRPGVQSLVVHPFHWGEVPAFAQLFAEGAEQDYVVALSSEFLHADYAYEAELYWDMWIPKEEGNPSEWERVPRVVGVTCMGPEFELDGVAERGHVQIACGLDSLFLPPEPDMDPDGDENIIEAGLPLIEAGTDMDALLETDPLEGVVALCYRDNIAQLLGFSRWLEENLSVEKRLLWSGSGEDMAELIREAWG
jgi:hypothetical protein